VIAIGKVIVYWVDVYFSEYSCYTRDIRVSNTTAYSSSGTMT